MKLLFPSKYILESKNYPRTEINFLNYNNDVITGSSKYKILSWIMEVGSRETTQA